MPICVGLSNLTSLSIRKSSSVKPDGMRAFSNLFNLEKLDLERCSEIHGGFVHLKGIYPLISCSSICKKLTYS